MIMMVKIMKLILNDKNIDIKVATTFKERLLGLMGQKKINYGLLLPNCSAIHTFFMRFSIDLIILNNENQIIALKSNLRPWHLFSIKKTGFPLNILELPVNSINNLKKSDYLIFK